MALLQKSWRLVTWGLTHFSAYAQRESVAKLYQCYSCRFQCGPEGTLLPGSGSSFSWGLSGRLGFHIWDQCGARGTAGASARGPGERADCCTNFEILKETRKKQLLLVMIILSWKKKSCKLSPLWFRTTIRPCKHIIMLIP